MTEQLTQLGEPRLAQLPAVDTTTKAGPAPEGAATPTPSPTGPCDPAPARFVYHCTLRWSDLDAYGHVNNARFLTLYEEARVALMFTNGRAWGVDFSDGVVIRRHEVDYLRPVGYSMDQATPETAPTVRIELWVESMRAGSFVVGYELYDGETLAGTARSVLVPFDLRRQVPRRLTDAEREFLLRYATGRDANA